MNRDNAHAHLVAGDGLEAAELLGEVREADGVVEDAVGAVVVGVGPGPPTMQMTGRFSMYAPRRQWR